MSTGEEMRTDLGRLVADMVCRAENLERKERLLYLVGRKVSFYMFSMSQ